MALNSRICGIFGIRYPIVLAGSIASGSRGATTVDGCGGRCNAGSDDPSLLMTRTLVGESSSRNFAPVHETLHRFAKLVAPTPDKVGRVGSKQFTPNVSYRK